MDPAKAQLLADLAPAIAVVVIVVMAAWVTTTWLRIKNGYPLDDGMGGAHHPQVDRQAKEEIKLLNQENSQLRDELASLKNRLASVETIVTDSGYGLDQEIERLRDRAS